MKIHFGLIAIAIAIAFPVAASAAAQTEAPVAGIYQETDDVTAANTSNGGSCPYNLGINPSSALEFAGFGKTGSVVRYPFENGSFNIYVATATSVSVKNSTVTTSGSFKLVPAVKGISGFYKSVLRYTDNDAYSFSTSGTLSTYTSGRILQCTMSIESIYILTGALP